MKLLSGLVLALGFASASEPTDAAESVEGVEPYMYNYHYCSASSQCSGYYGKCAHYSYWYGNNHYDVKKCINQSGCGKWVKRGSSNSYTFCYTY